MNADNTVPVYNSSLNPNYDVVIYGGLFSGTAFTNNMTQLTNYYNAGIGVVLNARGIENTSIPTAMKISNFISNDGLPNVNYTLSNPNNHALSYGCSSTIINGDFSFGKNFTLQLNAQSSLPSIILSFSSKGLPNLTLKGTIPVLKLG